MNKYLAYVVCVALVCITIITCFYLSERKDRYIFEHFDDRYMVRIDTKTGDTWEYKTNGRWDHKSGVIW